MTQRLYYDNAYLASFDARVTQCAPDGDTYLVRLDRSAFYPTSGGQPYDTGTLGGARVVDVFVEEGDVVHRVSAPLPVGGEVRGQIDWPRRFDHMQQHCGEHMLANAVWRQLGGHVIGLHLGAEASSIDADLPDGRTHIAAEELRALEDAVNENIQRDVPVVCSFPDAQTLAKMPLRKPPTVREHIRVVAIGDFEYVACGGTHPSTTGQVGLLKIIDARPSKGKLRLTFVCGKRAFANYRHVYDLAHAAAAELSTAVENLPGAVAALRAHLREAERAAGALRREKLLAEVPALLEKAPRTKAGARLVAQTAAADIPLLRDLATALTGAGNAVALLAAPQGEGFAFVFARSGDVQEDMGALLAACARANGGKGGGRPDFAQGGGPAQVLEAARAALLEKEG
ncbi:MAG TPA: hypothetical protein IAA75_09905 [Candidatus Pullichristensenella avicola]|nr:hypothetical protein [Candidatus Pullichristensenella avicola]